MATLSANRDRGKCAAAGTLIGIGIAVLQCVWLGWWLAEPLPNSGNVGGRIYRFFLLSRMFPEVVPGVSYGQSRIGQIAEGLGHPENLLQRGPILLAAASIVLAGLGLGDLILRGLRLRSETSWRERAPLSFGLGMIVLSLLTLGLGRIGLLNAVGIRGLLAVLVGWFGVSLRFGAHSAHEPHEDRRKFWPVLGFAAIAAPFLVLMILAAMHANSQD